MTSGVQIEIEVHAKRELPFVYPISKFTKEGKGKFVIPPSTVTYKELLYCNVIGCLTAVYDTKTLGKQFMPLIRKDKIWVYG